MDYSTIAKSIWAQFVTAWNVPIPFLTAVIAVGFFMRWHFQNSYERRLANAASTEKLLERQLQEYRDKTGSDTPDAVKTRIDALEQRIGELVPKLAAMQPRKVSVETRQKMVPFLDPFKGQSIEIASDAASADAAQMAKGLVAAFNSAGWITQTPIVMGIGNPPPTGVAIKVGDPNNLTPAQRGIVDAFRTAGIDFDFEAGPLRSMHSHEVPKHLQRPSPIAEITLTTRLED